LVEADKIYAVNQRVCALTAYRDAPEFLFYVLNRSPYFLKFDDGVNQTHLLNPVFKKCPLALPPAVEEQRAIAEALSDVDGLLGGLDRLIAKKRDLKQAATQQLLTGQTRLPDFHGEWEVKVLGEITDSFDNLRVPLNEAQREKMKGDHPYCGANGVLGFVDNYVIDDDIILMAEDGGYFDEYETRPIAYRVTGKCWVNNHAHVLKAKPDSDQSFLFYSLVHKNILPFLASGTRAKLNKSEMNKIEVSRPKEQPEQTAIAEVLAEMDAELAALEQRREKTRDLKQAMMQELLTGRTRLL
jgi:type I restriction enzyme, S subunit